MWIRRGTLEGIEGVMRLPVDAPNIRNDMGIRRVARVASMGSLLTSL